MLRGQYHSLAEIEKLQLSLAIRHAELYLGSDTDWPRFASNTEVERSVRIIFSFTDEALRDLIKQPERYLKPVDTALRFGYRGFSKGGKNGVFNIRRSDGGLINAARRIEQRDAATIEERLTGNLTPVKIVWHSGDGTRIPGLIDEENNVLFGPLASY